MLMQFVRGTIMSSIGGRGDLATQWWKWTGWCPLNWKISGWEWPSLAAVSRGSNLLECEITPQTEKTAVMGGDEVYVAHPGFERFGETERYENGQNWIYWPERRPLLCCTSDVRELHASLRLDDLRTPSIVMCGEEVLTKFEKCRRLIWYSNFRKSSTIHWSQSL